MSQPPRACEACCSLSRDVEPVAVQICDERSTEHIVILCAECRLEVEYRLFGRRVRVRSALDYGSYRARLLSLFKSRRPG
jgi:hypothetical protein